MAVLGGDGWGGGLAHVCMDGKFPQGARVGPQPTRHVLRRRG